MSETTGTNELAGYVPSAEAVKKAARAWIDQHDHVVWDGLSDEGQELVLSKMHTTLIAAVPVEVAREVGRLLGEVRALAERWANAAGPLGVTVNDLVERQCARDLRAVLDTVGVPALRVASCGSSVQHEAHPWPDGVWTCVGVPAQVLCECPPCPGRGNDGHGMTHCAECCFGTGVEADMDCPEHGVPVVTAIDGRCKARTDFSDPRAINIRCDLSAGHRGPHELVTREVLKSWDDPRAVPAQVQYPCTVYCKDAMAVGMPEHSGLPNPCRNCDHYNMTQPAQVDDSPCAEELHSWDYFTSQQVDSYWMRCSRVGQHDEHENSDTGATWTTTKPAQVDEAAMGGQSS